MVAECRVERLAPSAAAAAASWAASSDIPRLAAVVSAMLRAMSLCSSSLAHVAADAAAAAAQAVFASKVMPQRSATCIAARLASSSCSFLLRLRVAAAASEAAKAACKCGGIRALAAAAAAAAAASLAWRMASPPTLANVRLLRLKCPLSSFQQQAHSWWSAVGLALHLRALEPQGRQDFHKADSPATILLNRSLKTSSSLHGLCSLFCCSGSLLSSSSDLIRKGIRFFLKRTSRKSGPCSDHQLCNGPLLVLDANAGLPAPWIPGL